MNNNNYRNRMGGLSKSIFSRGEIIFARGVEGIGSEQKGDRYGVVIQNPKGNTHSPTVIIAWITSSKNKKNLPVHVEIDGPFYGLEKESIVLLEQLRTVDKIRITNRCGILDELTMRKVDKALTRSIFNTDDESILEHLPINVRKYVVNKLNFIDKCNTTITMNQLLGSPEEEIKKLEMLRKDENEGLLVYCKRNGLKMEELVKSYYDIKNNALNRVMSN